MSLQVCIKIEAFHIIRIILELAYALTVHKSQGSEFGTVVLVVGGEAAP